MKPLSIDEQSKKSLEAIKDLKLYNIYKNLPYTSLKNDSYFLAYEEIFNKYVGKKITFVEVGVLHGGSLFMWKEYFGPQARIIGIDLDPAAKDLEKYGFEIFIGSQSDKNFWINLYSKIGPIDIFLDDGGHVNDQQIISISETVNNINNGGVIVTEDTHTSYLRAFGNPSRYSFINYSKFLIDVINSRFSDTNIKIKNNFDKKIFSINFYESIVAFYIDSRKCFSPSVLINNGKNRDKTYDARNEDYSPSANRVIKKYFPKFRNAPVINKILRYFFYKHNFVIKIKYFLKLKKYFK
jgi:hypothetical protein